MLKIKLLLNDFLISRCLIEYSIQTFLLKLMFICLSSKLFTVYTETDDRGRDTRTFTLQGFQKLQDPNKYKKNSHKNSHSTMYYVYEQNILSFCFPSALLRNEIIKLFFWQRNLKNTKILQQRNMFSLSKEKGQNVQIKLILPPSPSTQKMMIFL